jgi:quercetin dioxygenase-like cupin family protein
METQMPDLTHVASDHHHGELVRAPLDHYLVDGVDERGLLRLVNVMMVADHAPLPVCVVGADDVTASPLIRSSEQTGKPHPETGTTDAATLGVDMLYVPPGACFPPHTHPGHHLLMSVRGQGTVTYGADVIGVRAGDLYYIPALVPHAVGSDPEGEGHWLLSFGAPHKQVDATDRMKLVEAASVVTKPKITPAQTSRLTGWLTMLGWHSWPT